MPSDLLIAVAGEALIDLVPAGDTLAAHPGGGPFNTARTLGRLERPVAYLGRLSRDRFGERMAALLADDGVLPHAVVRTDDPTTLALAEVDAAGVATYRFYARGTSAPGLTEADAVAALPPATAILHVGTLGLVLEPMASALEALVARTAGDALVMVDPNCRPALPLDRGRLTRVLAGTDVVKVSEDDLAWLSPGAAPLDAARALLDEGPAVVLVTRGRDGAVAVGPAWELPVPAPRSRWSTRSAPATRSPAAGWRTGRSTGSTAPGSRSARRCSRRRASRASWPRSRARVRGRHRRGAPSCRLPEVAC